MTDRAQKADIRSKSQILADSLLQSANICLPLPLGRRACETKSKKTQKTSKAFMHRVSSAQRGRSDANSKSIKSEECGGQRKLQTLAKNHRKLQIGVCHLWSVTLSTAPEKARNSKREERKDRELDCPQSFAHELGSIIPPLLRWARSRESSRRIASESYRSDSNHWHLLAVTSPLKIQKLVLTGTAFVVPRFESRDWRSLV